MTISSVSLLNLSSRPRRWLIKCGLPAKVVAGRMVGRLLPIAMLSIVALGPAAWLPRQAVAGSGDQAGAAGGPDSSRLTAEFHQDFRAGKFDYKALKLAGGDAEQLVKAQRGGLRILMPAGLNNPAGVGIVPRFRIHGDFEITVTYAIIKADNPVRGYGLAAAIWAETGTPNNDAVTVERSIIPKEGERYNSTRVSGEGPPEVRKYDVRRVNAQSRSGKIRLERVGSTVTASYAEGKEPFHIIRTVELGPEDLTMVRIGAETGVSDHSIEIRLDDLTIRAEALPGFEGQAPEPAAGFPWALAAGGVSGLALLAVAVWWLAAAKRSQTKAPAPVRKPVKK
jgi:hypothetical protein